MSHLIKSGDFSEMGGMFSKNALERLHQDYEKNWSEVEKNNIAVDLEDLTQVITEKVSLQPLGRDVFVDITVNFQAMKANINPLMTVEATLIFTRKYSQLSFKDWTITGFTINNLAEQ